MFRQIFIILLIFNLLSCTSNYHFEQSDRFKDHNWVKFNDLEYSFQVEAGKEYTILGELHTDSTFRQRKIEVGFYLYLPDGSERLEDKSIKVLDYDLNPLGKNMNGEFILPINVKSNLLIKESGTLKLVISNHSQYLDNYGFAGLKIMAIEK